MVQVLNLVAFIVQECRSFYTLKLYVLNNDHNWSWWIGKFYNDNINISQWHSYWYERVIKDRLLEEVAGPTENPNIQVGDRQTLSHKASLHVHVHYNNHCRSWDQLWSQWWEVDALCTSLHVHQPSIILL